jgi:ABC-type transport system substrate-binding protein
VNAFKASTLTGAAAKPIIGVDKVDDLSVKFTMDMPWATWPFGLTGQAGVLPAPEQLDDKANGQQVPIGTGPFKYQSWQRDNVFVAVKNQDYWRKSEGLPYLEEIDFRPIPDATARYNSIKSGDINLTVSSAETTINKFLEDAAAGSLQVTRSIGNNDVNMNIINVEKPPMDNVKVPRPWPTRSTSGRSRTSAAWTRPSTPTPSTSRSRSGTRRRRTTRRSTWRRPSRWSRTSVTSPSRSRRRPTRTR